MTYRLADALPLAVVREFEYEREQWFRYRGVAIAKLKNGELDWGQALGKLSTIDRRSYERSMAAKLNQYLDVGYGSCILRRPDVRTIVAESLEFFHDNRVWTGDYVVMPNHVHALMRPRTEHTLERILQSLKGFTAKRINDLLNTEGKVWMRESYDHIVRDFEQLVAYQNYIRANPEKAKLRADEYTYREAVFRPEQC